MSLTRRLALGALALLAASSAGAQGKKTQGTKTGLFRRYTAQGRNPDGSAYSGTATLAEGVGGSVTVTWKVGADSYRGSGPLEDRVLTVDWGDQHPVVYVVMPDGELHGTWADGTALEKLTPG